MNDIELRREDGDELPQAPAPLLTVGEGVVGAVTSIGFLSKVGVATATVSAATNTGHALAGVFFTGVGLFTVNRIRRSEWFRNWAWDTVAALEGSKAAVLALPVKFLPVPPAGCEPLYLPEPEPRRPVEREPRRPGETARNTFLELFGEDDPTQRNQRVAEGHSPRPARSSRPARPVPLEPHQEVIKATRRAMKPVEQDDLDELDAVMGIKPTLNLKVGPLKLKEWVPFADEQPHLMLAAKTKGGKTTTAKFFLRLRIKRGEQIFIIDPHWSPHHWWGLPGAGGGEDFDEVREALLAVFHEYRKRLREYKGGKKTEEFTRLTVLVDEIVITKAFFDEAKVLDDSGPKPKLVKDDTWDKFLKVLGSGARKVGISVMLMTQSANVDDLGISGPLRENYARIALDARAIKLLIDEDGEKARRDRLRSVLPSQGDFPAVMEMNGEVYFLDRTKVVDVPKPDGAEDALWDGWVYETVATDDGEEDEDEVTVHRAPVQRPVRPSTVHGERPARPFPTDHGMPVRAAKRREDPGFSRPVPQAEPVPAEYSAEQGDDDLLAQMLAMAPAQGEGRPVAGVAKTGQGVNNLGTGNAGVAKTGGNELPRGTSAELPSCRVEQQPPAELAEAAKTWRSASAEEKAATGKVLQLQRQGLGKRDAISQTFGPDGRRYTRGKTLVDAAQLLAQAAR